MSEHTQRVTWTQGKATIEVEAEKEWFRLYYNGSKSVEQREIALPPAHLRATFAERGAYGTIGKFVVYHDKAQELLAIRQALPTLPVEIDHLAELRDLEESLYRAEDAIRRHDENPGIAYGQHDKAFCALSAWVASNRDLYDAEVARRRAEQAEYATSIGESLIARGQD